MAGFDLISEFKPTGDQPQAIDALSAGIQAGRKHQTLLGVTGSGKTFTVANVVQQIQRPTLVMAHNKTLAAQLASEFKEFFPNNAVEYFVSYYDYYQPEAYIPDPAADAGHGAQQDARRAAGFGVQRVLPEQRRRVLRLVLRLLPARGVHPRSSGRRWSWRTTRRSPRSWLRSSKSSSRTTPSSTSSRTTTTTSPRRTSQIQRPTLVMAHNKTLAAQLASEFKEFFPNNAVEYFVSYYDYYQPEAYI